MAETVLTEHFKRHIEQWSSDNNCSIEVKHCFTPSVAERAEWRKRFDCDKVGYETDCNLSITTPLSEREIWLYLNGTTLKTAIYDNNTTNYYGTEKQTVVHKSYYQQWLKDNSRILRRTSGGVVTKFVTSGVPLSDDVQTVISSQTMVDLRNPNSISEAEQQLTTALNDITGLEIMDVKGELEIIALYYRRHIVNPPILKWT